MKKLALALTVILSCLYGGSLFAQTTYFDYEFDDDTADPAIDESVTEDVSDDEDSAESISENSDASDSESSATRNDGTNTDTYKGAVFSGEGLNAGAQTTKTNLDSSISKTEDLKKLIGGWTNFLLGLAAALTLVAVVWAGLLYITSFVDEGQAEKAKKILMYLIMGILLILASYAIVQTLMTATI